MLLPLPDGRRLEAWETGDPVTADQAVALGLAQFPIDTARDYAAIPSTQQFTLTITRDAGYWLRDGNGELTKAFKHICWDGCMFSNEVMMKQQTWNDILAAMVQVRENHGWRE